MKKHFFGIDIGGTFIKGAIIDEDGAIKAKDKISTNCEENGKYAIKDIVTLCDSLLSLANMKKEDICALGMGVPGLIDSTAGVVVTSNNIGWENVKIAEELEKALSMPVKISNDANAAALGEMKFGYGGVYKNLVMLTLGTGIGGGIIIDGKIYDGVAGAGAELGHSVIQMGGEPCTCGRRGCFEVYASATALIRDTKRAMTSYKDSKLWEIGSLDAVNGKTAFDYAKTDKYAKKVVDSYIRNLACGITNMATIFRPEAIVLGGGVCAQGDALINPIKKILGNEIFGGQLGPQVEILIAKLGNDAGCLGAAALVM